MHFSRTCFGSGAAVRQSLTALDNRKGTVQDGERGLVQFRAHAALGKEFSNIILRVFIPRSLFGKAQDGHIKLLTA